MTSPVDRIRHPERAPHRAEPTPPEAGPAHRKPRGRTVVLTVGTERADAVASALSYWLMASADNYGSGEDDPALAEERALARSVLDSLTTTNPRSV